MPIWLNAPGATALSGRAGRTFSGEQKRYYSAHAPVNLLQEGLMETEHSEASNINPNEKDRQARRLFWYDAYHLHRGTGVL
jgi:hypothetical protein